MNSIATTFSTAGTRGAGLPFMFQKTWSRMFVVPRTTGVALQDLLVQAGPRYVKALKRARKSRSTQESKRRNG